MNKQTGNSIPLFIVLAVCIFRILYRSFFPNLYTDTLLLIEVAENFGNGLGMIHQPIPGVHTGTESVALTVLPTGYVYLIWFFSLLVHHTQASIAILDSLSICLFIFATVHLIQKLSKGSRLAGWVFLSYLMLSPTLLHPLPATDLLCLALLVSSIALMGKHPLHSSPTRLFLAGILLAACGWIRYAYIPFIGLIPVLLWVYLLTNKKERDGWSAVIYLLLGPIVFGIHFLFNSRPLPFLGEKGKYLFWNHLLHVDVFPLKALIYFNDSHLSWLAGFSHLPEPLLIILGVFLSIGILILAGRTWLTWWRNDHPWWALLFFGICIVNIGFLFFMSVTTPPETDWLPFWTFVMETRYYAPSQYVLLFTLIYLASNSYRMWTESQDR